MGVVGAHLSPRTRSAKVPAMTAHMCCMSVSDIHGASPLGNCCSACFDVELVRAPVTYQMRIYPSVLGVKMALPESPPGRWPGAHDEESFVRDWRPPERRVRSGDSAGAPTEASPSSSALLDAACVSSIFDRLCGRGRERRVAPPAGEELGDMADDFSALTPPMLPHSNLLRINPMCPEASPPPQKKSAF